MSSGARVTRLRLTASRDEDVARGAILVGDALAIATLPQARSARHYVVRRLDIGGFARDAAPQTVALQIERCVARLAPQAVYAGEPAAVAAPIVWFEDEAGAIAALAERVVAGPPPIEWFWRRIAGGAVTQPSRDAILRACLTAAAATPGGPRAVAALVERIERARPGVWLGGLERMIAASLLVRVFGGRPPPHVPAAADAAAVIARLPAPWRSLAATWLPRWQGDERAVLLVALALVACGAATPGAPRLLARAQAIAIAAAASEHGVRTPDNGSLPPRPSPPSPPPSPSPPLPPLPSQLDGETLAAIAATTATAVPVALPSLATAQAVAASAPAPIAAPGDAATQPDAKPRPAMRAVFIPDGPTAVGGLLFLLRPLAQLDLAGWLDRHTWAAESGFAARLLAGIARDHAAAADDPLLAALDVPAAADRARDRPLVRRAWTRAAARWLAAAELTVDGVVRRPAHVASTTTHIDVCFPLRAASVAVRLAGLDVDPGWVPWLGRVVRFHYLEGVPA